MTPNRPYLLRAFFDWIVDNQCTPHLVVDATYPHTIIPTQFVQDGQIAYSKGFGVRDVRGTVLVGHNGGAPGIGAQFDLLPDGGVLIVLANNDMALRPVLRAFYEALAGGR